MSETDSYTTTNGNQAENDWYKCVDYENCPFVGIVYEGWRHNKSCPSCGSDLLPYEGLVYVCSECDSEYLTEEDAIQCCS